MRISQYEKSKIDDETESNTQEEKSEKFINLSFGVWRESVKLPVDAANCIPLSLSFYRLSIHGRRKNLWTSEKFQILAPSIIVSSLRTSNSNLTNSLPWYTIYIDSVSAAAKSQRVCQNQSVKRWKINLGISISVSDNQIERRRKIVRYQTTQTHTVNIWHLISCNIIHGKPFDWILARRG